MSYVAEPLFRDTATQTYKEQHKLSAEEFALLPFTPLLGNPWDFKKVVLQPVSIEDVATAVFKTSELPMGKRLIDAVGKEEMTQEDFFKFFTDLLGKPFRPFYIPIEAAKIMAERHPFGHCTPYAVEFCEKDREGRSSEEFEKLLGVPPKTLAEVYQSRQENPELVIPRPPLLSFTREIFRNLWRHPERFSDTLKAGRLVLEGNLWHKKEPVLTFSERPKSFRTYPYTSMNEGDFNQLALNNRRI